MAQYHSILRQIIELHLPESEGAFGLQDRFSEYFRLHVIPALDELFSSLVPSDQVLEIDYLEINLGKVSSQHLCTTQFLDKLIAGLSEVIIRKLEEQQTASLGNSYLDQWLHFLEYGYVPWQHHADTQDWLPHILSKVATQTVAVRKLNALLERQNASLDRLVLQHDYRFLIQLLEALSGASYAAWHGWMTEMARQTQQVGAQSFELSKLIRPWPRQILKALFERYLKGLPTPEPNAFLLSWIQAQASESTQREIFRVVASHPGRWPLMNRLAWHELEWKLTQGDLAQEGQSNFPGRNVADSDTFSSQSETKSSDQMLGVERENPHSTPQSEIATDELETPPAPSGDATPDDIHQPSKPDELEKKSIKQAAIEKPRPLIQDSFESNQDQPASKNESSQPTESSQTLTNDPQNLSENNLQERLTSSEYPAEPILGQVANDYNEPVDRSFDQVRDHDDATDNHPSTGHAEMLPQTDEARSNSDPELPDHSLLAGTKAGSMAETNTDASSLPLKPDTDPDPRHSETPNDSPKKTNSSDQEPKVDPPREGESSLLDAAHSPPPIREEGTTPKSTRPQTETEWPYAQPKGPMPLAELYLQHAGLILIHPFLPSFFENLDLLTQRTFKDPEAQMRAVHLLHYLGTKEESVPEYLLALPKVLCGLPIELPISRDIVLTEADKEECEALLAAVIEHWGVLGSTSPDGLREGFFHREGKLSHESRSWKLWVEKQTIDLLLDRLPWGLGIVKLPWMKEMMHVTWN